MFFGLCFQIAGIGVTGNIPILMSIFCQRLSIII